MCYVIFCDSCDSFYSVMQDPITLQDPISPFLDIPTLKE